MAERYDLETLKRKYEEKERAKADKKKAKLEENERNIGLCRFKGKLLPISEAKQAAGKCTAKSTQEDGRNTQRLSRLELEKNKPTTFPITPDHRMWSCEGYCGFQCLESLRLPSFDNISDLTATQWLLRHGLVQTKCEKSRCHGLLVICEKKGSIYFECDTCMLRSEKSDMTKFFSGKKLSTVKRIALIYHIISGEL